MEKRYQVFVSSTYEDLREERQEVMHALLELDCIPSGMELFPAANEDQWTTIKQVIEDCDYYIVIVAGRYGSLGPDGKSYTEMEYRYAAEIGRPTIAFIHKEPENLPAKKVEVTKEGKDRLDAFRSLLQAKLCKTWATPADLGAVVSRSLVRLIKQHPAVGWVRGDTIASDDAAAEILRLKKQIEDLQSQLTRARTEPPTEASDLAQGDDLFPLGYNFRSYFAGVGFQEWSAVENISWNDLFFSVSPLLIDEATEDSMQVALSAFIKERAEGALRNRAKLKGAELSEFRIKRNDFQTIKVQLRALGLIRQSEKKHNIKDSATYWTLTPYGETVMNALRAIRRAKLSTEGSQW